MQKDNTNESSRSESTGARTPSAEAMSLESVSRAAGYSLPPAASTAAVTPVSEKTLDRMTIIVGDMIGQWNRNRVRRGHTTFASTASCDALAKEIIHFILGNKP